MRYLLAAAAALCGASGASAAKDLTIQADPNSSSFEITQLRLVGAGMVGYFQEDMCNIGPCKIAPPVTYPVSIDITFTFAPISKLGWQTVESLSHYFPGTNSIGISSVSITAPLSLPTGSGTAIQISAAIIPQWKNITRSPGSPMTIPRAKLSPGTIAAEGFDTQHGA